jgi:transposase
MSDASAKNRWLAAKQTIADDCRRLQTVNMLKNHHLAKSIADAGWSQFLSILAFRAACAGKQAQAVSPAFTSRTYPGCGVLVQKGFSVRWHSCSECGMCLHRDHNAAKNRERARQARRGAVAEAAAENRASAPVRRVTEA